VGNRFPLAGYDVFDGAEGEDDRGACDLGGVEGQGPVTAEYAGWFNNDRLSQLDRHACTGRARSVVPSAYGLPGSGGRPASSPPPDPGRFAVVWFHLRGNLDRAAIAELVGICEPTVSAAIAGLEGPIEAPPGEHVPTVDDLPERAVCDLQTAP
jgi:hypothetical protein